MEDRLKEGVSKKGFHYPNQYETMSVETAFRYLDLARDGHDLLFSPDNMYGFKALLVSKCGVDIDYVFGPSFKEDISEIKMHFSKSNIDPEELEAEIKKRIKEKMQDNANESNKMAGNKNKLSFLKKLRQVFSESNKGSNERKSSSRHR